MKLRDRLHTHHEAPEHPTEAPGQVPESAEVVEHHRRVTTPPPEASRGVRWLRWIPAIILVVAGVVALALLIANDTGTEVTYEWPTATEGPASNTMGPIVWPAAPATVESTTSGNAMGPVVWPTVAAVPRTADGTEGWIRSTLVPGVVPRTADGTEGWIESLQIPPAVPRSADGTEGWIDAVEAKAALDLPGTADGAERWIESVEARELAAAAVAAMPLDRVIAELEANSQNQLPSTITPLLDELIAELEANSQNQL